MFHYIDGRKLEKGALWTTRTPYWMNMLKPWGTIINMKKNERLQNVHQARAANEEGLFSVLDCFEDLQDFIKECIINSAKAVRTEHIGLFSHLLMFFLKKKAKSGNDSKGPKNGGIEEEKKPLTKGKGRGDMAIGKDKAEPDADTGKRRQGRLPKDRYAKEKSVRMLNPALLNPSKLPPQSCSTWNSHFAGG